MLVCTVDRTHDTYIVAAWDAGCDVVTEKPMTTDAHRARRILDAQRRTGGSVTVWLLDLRHGADYFRRWQRDKANSGGLMVHRSAH